MKKKSNSQLPLKGMTDWEFEALWSEGRLNEWYNEKWSSLTELEKAKVKDTKALFKAIATADNIDHDLIFALMQLASNLYWKLVEQQAYQHGREQTHSARTAEFLRAMKTMKENPLALPFKPLALALEPVVTTAQSVASRRGDDLIQEVRNAAAKTTDPQPFFNSLIALDALPGKKHTQHLRNFFVCLFSEYFKHKVDLVVKIIQLCFHEEMGAGTLRQARLDFGRSFPNWRKNVKRLVTELCAPLSSRPSLSGLRNLPA